MISTVRRWRFTLIESSNEKTGTKRHVSTDTREHIKDTLLLMLKTSHFRTIRITALCREAHIARGTFYLYYNTIDDLLEDIINDSLQLINSMTPKEKQGSLKKLQIMLNQTGDEELPKDSSLFPPCHKYLELEKYRFLVKDVDVAPIIAQKIYQYESPKIVPVLMKELDMKQDEAELLFKFIVNGSSSVNRSLLELKENEWYRLQKKILQFILGGLKCDQWS